jgi:hypothetical protein
VTDQPTAPDYSKMPRPPADRPRLKPPEPTAEQQRAWAERLQRWADAAPADPTAEQDKDIGMTDAEVEAFFRESP